MEELRTETEWVRKEEAAFRKKCSTKQLEAWRAAGQWPDGKPFNWKKDGVTVLIEMEKGRNWEEELRLRDERYQKLQEDFQKASAQALQMEEIKKKLDEANAEMDRKVADYERKLQIESRERENIQGKLVKYGNAVEELTSLKSLGIAERLAWAITRKLPKKGEKKEQGGE